MALGWMIGLSNSPVLGAFLTPMLGLILAGLAALAGLQSDKEWMPRIGSFLPITAFTVSCALAGSAGIWARSHALLAPEISSGRTDSGFFSQGLDNSECNELYASSTTQDARVRLTGMSLSETPIGRALLVSTDDQNIFEGILGVLCE